QAAAAIGKHFSEPVLRLALQMDATNGDPSTAAAPPAPAGDLAPALRMLQHADLIHPEPSAGQPEYAFKHTLTQEVAYHSQLQETRPGNHGGVARAPEVAHAARLGEFAALLAHHWEAADKRYQALQWRRRAALRVTNIQVRRDKVRRSQSSAGTPP